MTRFRYKVDQMMTMVIQHLEQRLTPSRYDERFDALYRQSQTDAFEKLLFLVRLTHSVELDDFLKEYPAEIVDKMSERVWLMICVDHVAQLSDVPAIKDALKVYRTKACAEPHAASRR